MALAAATVFECRTAGNDTNGGAFVAGAAGTDYSQQNAKNTVGNNISTTDAVGAGSTTLTSATASFTSAIVGNVIYLQGGSGSLAAGWYQVVTFTNATTIVLDRSVASGTGITMNIGGALLSPGIAASLAINGNTIYIKSGTYTVSTASTNVANGCVTTTQNIAVIGYGSVRDDFGTRPLLQASGISTFTLVNMNNTFCVCANINVDGAGLTSSRGFLLIGLAYNLGALNCTNNGFKQNGTFPTTVSCFATGCSAVPAFDSGRTVNCVAYNNTAAGFSCLSGGSAVNCLSYGNTGATTDGFIAVSTAQGVSFLNCTAYGNGRDGFRFEATQCTAVNCLAEGNTGWGVRVSNNSQFGNANIVSNCGTYNNTAGGITLGTGNTGVYSLNPIVGSSTFFTNAAGGDFSLTGVAGGGGSARAAGIPGAFVAGATTGFIDLGAAQTQFGVLTSNGGAWAYA